MRLTDDPKRMVDRMTGRVVRRLDFYRNLLLLVAAFSVAVPHAAGQAAAGGGTAATEDASPKLPAYDVASIKLNKSGRSGVDIDVDLDLYSAMNISLKQLLENVYNIRQDLISGVTGPVASARFDLMAKILEPDRDALKKLSNAQRRAMLLPVLQDRFQLKAHTETKILPVYELVVVRGGPKFQRSLSDNKQDSGTSVHGNGRRTVLTAHDRTMASLADTLTYQVHRTVIDKTGLEGDYDFTLEWAPENLDAGAPDAGPSIFTALPEQMGVKLQPTKGPVETLVVDHVEMPTEN